MTVDQVVDVVSVRHRVVATPRTVHVVGGVTPAVVRRRADIGVGLVDGQDVLVDVVVVGMMQVAVVEIVHVTVVQDARVSAAWTMHVIVIGVDDAVAFRRHGGETSRSL